MPVAEIFDAVAGRMCDEHADVSRGRMLRAEAVRTGDKYFAFVGHEGDLVVKLPEARVAELVASGEGRPLEMPGRRPMREWVRLLPNDAGACDAYMREAREFVARLIRRSGARE
jgi:hypothetical protein